MTNTLAATAAIIIAIAVSGCSKKPEDGAMNNPPAATDAQSAAPNDAAAQSDAAVEDQDRARKQAALDYATMEDQYINDANAQWATAATASSFFGKKDNSNNETSQAANVVGRVDGKTWTNDEQTVGFDWIEATFANPVNATEVRIVFQGDAGVEAVSKIELQDTAGTWHTVWSGLSDVKGDQRGERTWFAKTFDKTSYQANKVKVTIANNVQAGYKVIDAIQLVGASS